MADLMIIGKNGQLGVELVLFAKKLNRNFVAFGKEELDITDQLQLKKVIEKNKPKIIINTSAYHVVPDCEINPLLAFEVNCVAVRNLAKLCKENNILLVTYSTDYVFDGKKGKPYNEDDVPNPLQMYGLSKLAGEFAALNTYPKGSYIIRTCGVYGGMEGSRSKRGNFVINILKEAEKKDILEVSSEQIVNPTYAKDLAKASLGLLELNPKPGIYHLVNEGYLNWYEFAKKILEYANIEKKILPVDRGGKTGEMQRPKFSALTNTKAKKLGIILPPIEDGLKNYLKNVKYL
jgi:dTDP-4-dehydrorhamnose reductase